MKSAFNRVILVVFVMVIICQMMRYLLNYEFGYYESYTFDAFDDAICFLTDIIEYIVFPVFIIIWIVNFFKKKHHVLTTLMLVGMLVFLALKQMMPNPNNLVIYGLRDRMMRDYSIETIRLFAWDFDKLPRLSDGSDETIKEYLNEDLTKTGLKDKYPFLSWPKGNNKYEGPYSIYEKDGVVYVQWGGTLTGYWGFNVVVEGKKIAMRNKNDQILSVNSDICFFYKAE